MDMLFSCLFTALAAVHLASSAPGLPSSAAALPWVLHLLAASLPAVLAWQTPHWWEELLLVLKHLSMPCCPAVWGRAWCMREHVTTLLCFGECNASRSCT